MTWRTDKQPDATTLLSTFTDLFFQLTVFVHLRFWNGPIQPSGITWLHVAKSSRSEQRRDGLLKPKLRGDAFEEMKQQSGGDYWSKHKHCAVHSQCKRAAAAGTSTGRHTFNYLAVVCQWIPPSRVLRTLTLPFLWGVDKVQLLGGGRVRMKLMCAEAVQQKCIHPKVCMSVRWMEKCVAKYMYTHVFVCVGVCTYVAYFLHTPL